MLTFEYGGIISKPRLGHYWTMDLGENILYKIKWVRSGVVEYNHKPKEKY